MSGWDFRTETEVKAYSWKGIVVSIGMAIAITLVMLYVLTAVSSSMMNSFPDCNNVTNETKNLSQMNATWCKYDNGTGGYILNGTVWNHTDGYLT
jgi:hypothetical protein